jgi:hypothetical protein
MSKSLHYGTILILVVLTMTLVACGSQLPPDAQTVVLSAFDIDANAKIIAAQQVEPIQQDLAVGAEQVWCASISFTCWSCDFGEWRTCSDSRLVRLIDGEWQVSLLMTDEDKELYEARGCELMVDTLAR